MTVTLTIVPFILLGIWLILWSIYEVFALKESAVFRAIMIIVAVLAGLGLIFVR